MLNVLKSYRATIGERGNSVYARGLQVMEGKGRMGRPKHSGEKGE